VSDPIDNKLAKLGLALLRDVGGAPDGAALLRGAGVTEKPKPLLTEEEAAAVVERVERQQRVEGAEARRQEHDAALLEKERAKTKWLREENERLRAAGELSAMKAKLSEMVDRGVLPAVTDAEGKKKRKKKS